MISKLIKYPYHQLRKHYHLWDTSRLIATRNTNKISILDFEFNVFKNNVTRFIKKQQLDKAGIIYRYASSCDRPSLYSSTYACLTFSLLNDQSYFTPEKRILWKNYFDSFQNRDDGLFYDPEVINEHFNDSDWWGARHLAVHLINAYNDIGEIPKYPFRFLEKYHDLNVLKKWLDENKPNFSSDMSSDFDNKLMNISSLLQYERDFRNDSKAATSVEFIKNYLLKLINPSTGIWGDDNINDPDLRSRKVQFAYHLFPMFFYDNFFSFDIEKVIGIVLHTQNKFGGFGVAPNSSACEDIDSIDILTRFEGMSVTHRPQIRKALEKSFQWVLLNQMDDGGFVFRLNERFWYGHNQMTSEKNESAVFPTWFRTLSLAYLCRTLSIPNKFLITPCPGYEF